MAENRMELFIETLTGAAFELKVSPYETIMSIKAKIQYLEGIPIAQQHLIWQTKELEDDFCLQDYSITDGATLKLVLGMRGGPINTRRVSVESKQIQDLSEYVDGNSEELTERLSSGQPLTVLVFHDGDKVHMYTVIDRMEGNVSALSGSVSDASIKNLTDEEADDDTSEKFKENEVTRQKMILLQQQMQSLAIRRKPKRKTQPSLPEACKTTNTKSGRVRKSKALDAQHLKLPPLNPESKSCIANNISLQGPRKSAIVDGEMDNTMLEESFKLIPLIGANNLCASTDNLMLETQNNNHKNNPTNASFIHSEQEEQSASTSQDKQRTDFSQMLNLRESLSEKIKNVSVDSDSYIEVKQSASIESLPYLPPAPESNDPSFRKSKRTSINFQTQSLNTFAPLDVKPLHSRATELPNARQRYTSVTGTSSVANRRLLELDQWLNNRPKTTPSKEDESYNVRWDIRLTSSLKVNSREKSFSRSTHRLGLGALVAAGLRAIKSPEQNQNGSKPKYPLSNKSESTHASRPHSGHKLPPIKPKKKVYKRCSWCNKRTGLATSYICRCGKNFCASHRYAEMHRCSYDYKSEGRRFLQQSNPVITAPKLPKI